MWPSTPASRSFASRPCPRGSSCTLPNCLFGHDAAESPGAPPPQPPTTTVHGPETVAEHPKPGENVNAQSSRAAPAPGPDACVNSDNSSRKKLPTSKAPEPAQTAKSKSSPASNASTKVPSSSSKTATAQPVLDTNTPVVLRPRPLPKEPAPFTRRLLLLKTLHDYMKVQNDRIIKAKNPDIKALHLNTNELIQLALDEEEKIAKSHPSVYENIVKQRLVKIKGMPPEAWAKERRLAKAGSDPAKKEPPARVKTDLSPEDEITFVRTLKCDQRGLDEFGYVTHLPSDAEVNETRLALDVAAGWEVCARCSTRFQVFPDRNEQGKLTTGGECLYHWGKVSKSKYTCCDREIGTQGCTTHETHVFSHRNPKRMSLLAPFIHTPANDKVPKSSAVTFDCEMGYTTYGMELLRLTVISWPQYQPLVDVLVRPFGQILDFNTRFSGVSKEQFINAKAYDPANPRPIRKDLRIVDSLHAARDLFLAHVSPETPVIGHALENDLNTIRLIHPVIIDTVLLYPTRKGLPMRFGLRQLAKDHLNEDIQQAGEAGHDSYEDARTAGELVRHKIKKKWALKKADGFEIRDGGVYPPMPRGQPPPSSLPVADMRPSVPTANMTGPMETRPAIKRKLDDKEEEEDSTEPPPKKFEAQRS